MVPAKSLILELRVTYFGQYVARLRGAALFRVDPKTVTRWAQQGKLHSIRTLGGHRRYSEAEIQQFLDDPQRVPLPRAAGE